MALINENFLKLSESYLFTEIARKVNAYKEEHPKADVISLGIGDVTQPLAPAVIEALHKATDEMAIATTFRGYGPERGYDFLREAIVIPLPRSQTRTRMPSGCISANSMFARSGNAGWCSSSPPLSSTVSTSSVNIT